MTEFAALMLKSDISLVITVRDVRIHVMWLQWTNRYREDTKSCSCLFSGFHNPIIWFFIYSVISIILHLYNNAILHQYLLNEWAQTILWVLCDFRQKDLSDGNKVSYSDIVRISLHCLNGIRSHVSRFTEQELQVYAQTWLVIWLILQGKKERKKERWKERKK